MANLLTIPVRTGVRRAYIANQQARSVTYGIIPHVVRRYPARTHEGDLQNMTDQNAQHGPESRPDAGGVSPAPGVVITPPVGIQWQKDQDHG